MTEKKLKIKKINAVIYSALITLILFGIFLTVILFALNIFKQREEIETTDRFITFENKVERLIYSNVTLLQGFEAYIEINPDLDELGAYDYLENLLSENSDYIKNVGVIKDTTIIWNYPSQINSLAIGTDLSKVDSQKDNVLKVKNENVSIIQGPVELVQGGQAFIVRTPVLRDDVGYWGQISIVLKCEEIIAQLDEYAEEADLNVAIYNQTDTETPFFGSIEKVGDSPLVFNIDKSFINWDVHVTPETGWQDSGLIFFAFTFLAFLVSGFVGIMTYNGMRSQYQLKVLTVQDALTGLYNRRYLDVYQKDVLSSAIKDGRKFGVMSLDINSFKSINDTFGHIIGDKVLVETSRILKKRTKRGETVFRTGGDEFLIILPDITDVQDVENYKTEIKKAFLEEFKVKDLDIKATPSIGFSIFPDDGKDIDILLHKADKEMYREKPDRRKKS